MPVRCMNVSLCACHVQACPSALPPSLFPPNVYDVPALPPCNLSFPVEHCLCLTESWCLHTLLQNHAERKGGRVIQFDKDQEPLSSLPSGSHPFTQTLEEEYWEACQPLTYSHTLSHIHSNICVVRWGQRVRKLKSLPLISVLND